MSTASNRTADQTMISGAQIGPAQARATRAIPGGTRPCCSINSAEIARGAMLTIRSIFGRASCLGSKSGA